MRAWRLMLLALAGVLAAVAGTVLAVALNVATGGSARWFPTMERYRLWWTAGATLGVAGAGLVVWWAQRWYDRSRAELVPAVRRPEPWVVDRPAEVGRIVAALLRQDGGTVGITTAVQGAGGFGKTTVAKMVCADQRVSRRYRGRIYWVTLGRDAVKEMLPGLVNGLIAQLDPGRPVTFTSSQQASEHLAAILAKGPQRLIVLDDVWNDAQLAAFPVTGRCARLVTTRIPSLTGGSAISVRVDQMTERQARALLLGGLPRLPRTVAAGLLEETGRWPLLLRLVNQILAHEARLHADISKAAEDLLGLLRARGALQMDQLSGAAAQQLDPNDPDQRKKAVRATIEASTGLLTPGEYARLAELGIFAEDETVPLPLIAGLWQETASMAHLAAEQLVIRLDDLALLSLAPGGDTVTMHDVVRDYLRGELGHARLTEVNRALLHAAAGGLPRATAIAGGGTVTAWWELPAKARYLRDHLIDHLAAGGTTHDAEATATDLRWIAARLNQVGPAAPYADLTTAGTSRALRLRRLVGQSAHLLAPTDPPHCLTDILYSRVSHDPDWGPQARILAASRALPALRNAWPLPDLPSPAQRRIITGHTDWVRGIAIAPGGTWLATASDDQTARIWDAVSGQCRAVLTGHTSPVTAVAIAPDGSWLATGSHDGTARIWDAATGRHRTTLALTDDRDIRPVIAVAIAPDGTWLATACSVYPDGSWGRAYIWDIATGRHGTTLSGSVRAATIAPDGTWLATGSKEGTAWIWDPSTGQHRTTVPVTGRASPVTAVAIAPDGTWLATGSDDQTARIWDAVSGQCRAVLAGHTGPVTAVAIAPDGDWLATASNDWTIRTWDTKTRQPDADAPRRFPASAVIFAPDGSWLATGSDDGTIRIWDVATGLPRTTLTGHKGWVRAAAIAPGGTWLATGSDDGTARIWDITTRRHRIIGRPRTTGLPRATLTGHKDRVRAVAVAPGGTWLATGGDDGTIRIWDIATGRQRTTLTGHDGAVRAVAIAPDGTWLGAGTGEGTAHIWDTATGRQRAVLSGHADSVTAVAIAPDGTWLATASGDGTVRIWETRTGEHRTTLTGHDGAVMAVAIDSRGTWLATASSDRTVRIWAAASGECRAVMRVDRPLSDCAWSPSGHLLAVAGSGGLYLFALDS